MNFRPGIPRYLQIADSVRRDLKGDGERIPSEHALCAKFRVSRPTVRQALDVLVQEGRLYRHAGRGTFATGAAANDRRLRVIGSVDDMMALGDETWFKTHHARSGARAGQHRPGAPPAAGLQRLPDHAACVTPRRGRSSTSPRGCRRRSARRCPTKICPRRSLIGAIERLLNTPIKFLEQTVDAALAPRTVAEMLQLRAPHAAAALRAHLFRGQRRAGRVRAHLPDQPAVSVSRRALPGRSPELTGRVVPGGLRRRGHVHRLRPAGPVGRADDRQAPDDLPRSLGGLPGRSRRADGQSRRAVGRSWPRPFTAPRWAPTSSSSARRRAWACSRPVASATCSSSGARSATRSTTSRSRSRAR